MDEVDIQIAAEDVRSWDSHVHTTNRIDPKSKEMINLQRNARLGATQSQAQVRNLITGISYANTLVPTCGNKVRA